jgi:hypothetical protein
MQKYVVILNGTTPKGNAVELRVLPGGMVHVYLREPETYVLQLAQPIDLLYFCGVGQITDDLIDALVTQESFNAPVPAV